MKELDKFCIHFAIAQEQQILEAKSAKLADLPSFIVLAFLNRSKYRNTDGRIRSAMNWRTSEKLIW